MTIPSNFLKANEANNTDKQKGTTISGVLYLSHYDDKGDKIKDFSPYEFTFIVNSAPILQDSIAVIKTTNGDPMLGVAFNLPKEQLLYTLNDLDKFLITCKINDEEIGTATVPINDVNIDYDTTGNLVAKISSENPNFYANNSFPAYFSFIKQSFSHQENCTVYFISDWAYTPSSGNLDVVFEVTLIDKAGLSTTKSATSSTTKLSPPILTYHDGKTISHNDSDNPHIIKVKSGDTFLPITISFADKDEAGYSVGNDGITINTRLKTATSNGIDGTSSNIEINPGYNILEVIISKEDYFDCTTNYHIDLYTNTLYIAKNGDDNYQAAGATKERPLATKTKIVSLLNSFNDSDCDYNITIVNDSLPYDKDLDFSGINLIAKSLCITATDNTGPAIKPAAAQGEQKTLMGNTNCPLTIKNCKIFADTHTCNSPLVLMSSNNLTIQSSEFSYKGNANTLTSIIEFDASSCNEDITLTITDSKFESDSYKNKNAINLKQGTVNNENKLIANITNTDFYHTTGSPTSFAHAISCDGNVELTMNKVNIKRCEETALVLNNATCKINGGSFMENNNITVSTYIADGTETAGFFGGAIRAINSELEILPHDTTGETIISSNSITMIADKTKSYNGYGGAIALLNNSKATITATMTNNEIYLAINSAISPSNLRGGALYIDKTSSCDLKLVKQYNNKYSINGNHVSVMANSYEESNVNASAFGGAIFNGGTLTIEGGSFNGNHVRGELKGNKPFYGQGIIYNTGKLTITGGSDFIGGGSSNPTNTSLIYATTDNKVKPENFGLYINGATFTTNDAGDSLGGAIYFAPNNSSIYDENKYQFEISGNTTFEECSALAGGAIYVNVLAAPSHNSTINNSSGTNRITFKKNQATGEFKTEDILHIKSCGGAIYMGEHTQLYCNTSQNSELNNSIVFQENRSESMGGALFFKGASFSSPQYGTTIVNEKLYFQENIALVAGGAIGAIFSDIYIAHAKFEDNECQANNGNSSDILDWSDYDVKFSGNVKIVDSEFIFPSHKDNSSVTPYLIALYVENATSSIAAGFQRNTFSYSVNTQSQIITPFYFFNKANELCFNKDEIVFEGIEIYSDGISENETFFKSVFTTSRDMTCPIHQQETLKTLRGEQLFQ